MDKLKLHTPDLTAQNIEKLAALFPNCVTETTDAKGKLKRGIDFDQLRQELSDHVVEGPRERYHLDWPGKREALLAANAPIAKTLRPCREESVDFDTTKNLFIEGDNLDALKLLQETYLGKVKLIYIDPPYNTGKDFIYDDDFRETTGDYLRRSNELDEAGNHMKANVETSGRFHSAWISMLYPRLKLARNLLAEDGVIFISIDDHEAHNVRRICAEIFGETNFCAQFIWNTEGNTDNQYHVKVNHEYVVAYYKNIDFADAAIGHVIDPNTPKESNLWKGIADNNVNKNHPANPPAILELPAGFPSSERELFYKAKEVDDDFFIRTRAERIISDEVKAIYGIESKSGLPVKLDDLSIKDFKLEKPCRVYVGMANRNKLEEFIRNGCKPIDDGGTPLKFYININAGVRYLRENDKPRNILSVLRGFGTTEKTKTYLKQLGITYDYPKPVGLIEYLIRVGCEREGIVMDFFAGSGTTAEAVANLNASESTKRRFICVQLPRNASIELNNNGGDTSLVSITKKRLGAVLGKLRESNPLFASDFGFRVLKIDTSNMKDVYYAPDAVKQDQLELLTDNIKEERTPEDLLFQVLVDWGVDLALPITQETIAKKKVFFVDGNALAACFDPNITEELVKELAKKKPLRAVFRDSSYGSDSVKINVEQIFKLLSPGTELKSL
jgi:adenine-specific DNA-methyltransferase